MTDATQLPTIVPVDTIAEMLRANAPLTLIDVRTPAEYAAEHIAASYNIPLDQVPAHTATLREALHGPAVLICASGNRARQAATVLSAADLAQVHVLDGGISAWKATQQPLIRGKARWSMERQVRGVAGGITLASVLGGLFVWRPLTAVAALVGTGLTVSALTDSCLMARLLAKLPFNQAPTCAIQDVVAKLSTNA
jgi:rhodanese-related sulfurtransferase